MTNVCTVSVPPSGLLPPKIEYDCPLEDSEGLYTVVGKVQIDLNKPSRSLSHWTCNVEMGLVPI